MEGVWRQGFRPLAAAQKPTNRASYQKREPRVAPNGNRENRCGPIWQIVQGVVPRHTDGRPSCSRLDYWTVDDGRCSALPREWAHRELVAGRF
jgi:hypothetical protein